MSHLFFGPDEGKQEAGRYERIRQAKEICRTCPVKQECGDHAIRTNEQFGIWGEMTERVRRRKRKEALRER